MISRVLVANRGEIVRRVFATCRRLGIDTVAVHSDADADLPFVREADRAVRLPGNTPAETYLRGELIIEAARKTGADAIHPGYGFLSENADFARAVEAAGLTWIGPAPESIVSMGSKVGSKDLMREAGVPVLGAPDNPTDADLPLLVKASAGGGGRGMRIVRSLADLEGEIATASSEAASAFGDGRVFVEPYVEASRHVEVQVVGDGAGEVLVFGERDCTVQRRHQKVVEEAPAPRLPASVAAELHEAARRAAAAINYRGAGTVEFLYDPARERFFFLEMNTRLQVEHPVTELVHGVDLVEMQLAVAAGEGLRSVPEVRGTSLEGRTSTSEGANGHAIEVRLYAEDSSWTPQSGPLVTLDIDHEASFAPLLRAGIRLDSGFESGNEVGTHYDAMLAKVISWAPTRAQAIRQLVAALRKARIHGMTVNRDQLIDILTDPAFASMDVTTSWLEGAGFEARSSHRNQRAEAVAAALMLAAEDASRRTVQAGIPAAWRNVTSQPQRTTLVPLGSEDEVVVEWFGGRTGFSADGVTVLSATPEAVRLEIDGVAGTYAGRIVTDARTGAREVFLDGPDGASTWKNPPRFTDPADQVAAGSLLAPMPGSVISVAVAAGEQVSGGQLLLVMEAMKMQHSITAPTDGVVAEINVEAGSQVAAGQVLVVVSDDLAG
jgi:propionyl-CoA carboxylase alpha chain